MAGTLRLAMVRIPTEGKEMPSASLTSKGQITIPKVIRDLLQVKTGDPSGVHRRR